MRARDIISLHRDREVIEICKLSSNDRQRLASNLVPEEELVRDGDKNIVGFSFGSRIYEKLGDCERK